MVGGKSCLLCDGYTFFFRYHSQKGRKWCCTLFPKCKAFLYLDDSFGVKDTFLVHTHNKHELRRCPDAQLITMATGKTCLLYGGYTFFYRYKTKSGHKWVCTNFPRCKAYLFVDENYMLKECIIQHCHEKKRLHLCPDGKHLAGDMEVQVKIEEMEPPQEEDVNVKKGKTPQLSIVPIKKRIITLPLQKKESVKKHKPRLTIIAKDKKEFRLSVEKYRTNLKEILLSSNATLIGSHSSIGFRCIYCKELFLKPDALKAHTLEEQNDVTDLPFMKKQILTAVKLDITSLRCILCSEIIDTLEQLVEHLKSVHTKKVYPDTLNYMLPFKFESDTLQCSICKIACLKFPILLEHMNTHFRNHVCEECDAGFVNNVNLKKHEERHKLGSFSCTHCSKEFDTLKKKQNHENVAHVHGYKTHKCLFCNERFFASHIKDAHMVKEHGVAPVEVQCQACDQKFSSGRLMRLHVKKDHLMERRHPCSGCDKSFFTKRELESHMKQHTGDKTYECDGCGKSYASKKAIAQHMRTHRDD